MVNIIDSKNVLVLGSGSWGTALALHLARLNYDVYLWGRRDLSEMQLKRENPYYLPGIMFPDNITCTNDLQKAVEKSDIIFYMLPSVALIDTLETIKPFYNLDVPFICGSKGLLKQGDDFLFLDDAIACVLGNDTHRAILSGPTFADEVASGMPTAIVVAANEKILATKLQLFLHNDNFRVYSSTDTKGIQICGAMKNVLAIASGISDGLKLGVNTRTALITRGLVEMSRVAKTFGCNPETLMGLTGMGDLVLTCTSDKSRNRRLGLALGSGLSLSDAIAKIGQVVEGNNNARTILRLAKANNLELPITEQVCNILEQKVSPIDAMQNLLNRAPKSEFIT
jgi:glycerol-3-phosphate dehydrogenase (NAD(P)+)